MKERVLLQLLLHFMRFPFRQGVSSSIIFYSATLLEESDDIRDGLYTTTATVGCLPSYHPPTTQQFSRAVYHIIPTHQPPRNNHPEILSVDYFKLP